MTYSSMVPADLKWVEMQRESDGNANGGRSNNHHQ